MTLPQTQTLPIAAGAKLCFDLPLQAGDAIHIEAPGLLNASGLITLLAPDGTVTVSHGYGFQIGGFLLDTGVAQSGTWQVQISNNNTTAGTLGSLSFSRLAIDGTIDLGGSANFTGTETLVSRHYLIRPGAATAVAYKLSVRSPRSASRCRPWARRSTRRRRPGACSPTRPCCCRSWRCRDSRGRRSTTP